MKRMFRGGDGHCKDRRSEAVDEIYRGIMRAGTRDKSRMSAREAVVENSRLEE